MRYAIPVVIVVAFTAWIMDLRRRGEPVGPALATAAKRWGPVVLVGFVVYGLLTMLMSILALVLAFMVIWMIVGIFTGGFLWADTSFAESMGAFGVVLAIIAVVVCVLLIVATVSLVKMLRRRMREWNATPVVAQVVAPFAEAPPAPEALAAPVSDPPAHDVAPRALTPSSRTRPQAGRRERPLRAAGR
ncbi:MAG TPA: hypothetical protein VI916_04820 [Acidimicrobiia bacterium]|nr:hypothetical protein [Acidimicrobiia bacterium]